MAKRQPRQKIRVDGRWPVGMGFAAMVRRNIKEHLRELNAVVSDGSELKPDPVTGEILIPETGEVMVMDPYTGEMLPVMIDTNKAGTRITDWADLKEKGQKIAKLMDEIADDMEKIGDPNAKRFRKWAGKMNECADELIFKRLTDDPKVKRLVGGFFCHDPLCPTDQTLKARKNGVILREVTHMLPDGTQMVMLTLTVPNCTPDELDDVLDRMFAAFSRMTERGWFERRFIGFWRKLEITVTRSEEMIKEDRHFHPHLHVLLVPVEGYFSHPSDAEEHLNDLLHRSSWNMRTSLSQCRTLEAAVEKVLGFCEKSENGLVPDDIVSLVKQLARDAEEAVSKKCWESVDAECEHAKEWAKWFASCDPRAAVKEFRTRIFDVYEPLYINEPRDHFILSEWRDCYGDDTITQVDIRKVGGDDEKSLEGAVQELVKYTCKSEDYMKLDKKEDVKRLLKALRLALFNRRQIGAGGIIAELKKEVVAKIGDEDDVLHCNEDGDVLGMNIEYVFAGWRNWAHCYVITQIMTKEEYEDMYGGDGDGNNGGYTRGVKNHYREAA